MTTATVPELLDELRAYLSPTPPQLSLPPALFASPEVYELERERIFHRGWVLVCHADQLAEPGDYLSLDIAGEPVVVTRGRDGALNAMSPVCRHRMMPLVGEGAGNTADFTCPYHLWRYGLDGKLIAATHMRGNTEFDPATCRLPGFAVEVWHGFVFVSLAGNPSPLAPELSVVEREMANYQLDDMVLVSSWTEDWACNWKVAVENGHENYHAIGFHPDTVRPLMTGGIDMDVHYDSPVVCRLLSPAGQPVEPAVLPLTEDECKVLYSFRVFPGGSVATFGETIAWLTFVPVAADRTIVRGGSLMPRRLVEQVGLENIRPGLEGFTARVNTEDREGLEAVQRAVTSRYTRRGHLSPKEQGVLAFYRSLAHALLG
ncbi:aromatic ring-hydroxylating oxygenase subunit alpha [Streptomyces huiliensis]|uniref:aromatic ring-hydroxylating oxygenase subunit alpha n=1 Tax=Streptomyces huiliensis TaxID=2876027 RepID=UPI001CC13002|nr:aromatic ring-hydroxylating dioxygenase subunit alpha [Streptomyces huiliensis]MBZ4319382.1 aromatic ring-hydroxylating dioxygenase subunit alpha [Streptomyces huiliensis]